MNRPRTAYAVTALLLVVCFAVAGAGNYDKKTLIGTWEFDIMQMYQDAMEKMGQEMPPGMNLEEMLKGNYMRIRFHKDGTYVFESKTMQAEQSEPGKWEVVKSGDGQVTVKTVNEKGEEMEIVMTFKDNDHFSALVVEGEEEMTLHATRVRTEEAKGEE